MMMQIELAPVNLPFLCFSMMTCGLNTTKQLNVIVITAALRQPDIMCVWVNEWMNEFHSEKCVHMPRIRTIHNRTTQIRHFSKAAMEIVRHSATSINKYLISITVDGHNWFSSLLEIPSATLIRARLFTAENGSFHRFVWNYCRYWFLAWWMQRKHLMKWWTKLMAN